MLDDALPQIPLGWIVVFISSGIIAHAAKRFYNLLIHLEKRTIDELRFQTIGLVFNVVLNLILIPLIGLLGAAIATFVSYMLVIVLIEMRYRLSLDRAFGWHLITFVMMALGVSFAFNWLFRPWYPLGLIFSAIASGTTYLALVYYTKQQMLTELKRSLEDFKKLV
jgi:O-antigen/teichoic acid export membrane protein